MKRSATAVVFALGVAVLTAAPAEAQLWFFPDYAAPSAFGSPSTFVAGTWGAGMNDASGKLNAFGAVVGRSGMADRITVLGGVGRVEDSGEAEWTFGGALGADLLAAESTTQVSLQGGLGYLSVDDGAGENFTSIRVPVGVALKAMVQSGTTTVVPWIMPRLNYVRMSYLGNSASDTDFGASAGASFTMASGFGFHAAVDMLHNDVANVWTAGAGIHYAIR